MAVGHHSMRIFIKGSQCSEGWEPLFETTSQVSEHYHFQMKGSLSYTFPETTLTFFPPDMRDRIVVGMEIFFFFFNTWLSPWGWITGPWLGYHERLSFSGWLQAKDLCNWDLENTSGHYAVCVDFHVTVDFWPCSHFHGLYAQYPSCKVPTTHSSPNQSPLICVLTSEFKKKPLSNPFRAPKSLETVPATRLAAKSKARNTVTCTN